MSNVIALTDLDKKEPGDPTEAEVFEDVELWTFKFLGGVDASYLIRPAIGEKGQLVKNAIDGTPVQVDLLFRTGDDKNEVAGVESFQIRNMLSFGMMKSRQQKFAKGQSPVEKELALHDERTAKRAAAWEARQAAIQADFEREMAEAEGK